MIYSQEGLQWVGLVIHSEIAEMILDTNFFTVLTLVTSTPGSIMN